jgi:hypothetical protein
LSPSRAERRAGQLLSFLNGSTSGRAKVLPDEVTHRESHDFQALAAIPDEDFNRAIEESKADGEVTRAGVQRRATTRWRRIGSGTGSTSSACGGSASARRRSRTCGRSTTKSSCEGATSTTGDGVTTRLRASVPLKNQVAEFPTPTMRLERPCGHRRLHRRHRRYRRGSHRRRPPGHVRLAPRRPAKAFLVPLSRLRVRSLVGGRGGIALSPGRVRLAPGPSTPGVVNKTKLGGDVRRVTASA